VDAHGLLHNRILALWPYMQINDPRLVLHDDFILIHADSSQLHAKLVITILLVGWPIGWRVCSSEDLRSQRECNLSGPRLQCGNLLDNNVIELETLGRLGRLEPGKSFFHTETWEFFNSLEQPFIPPTLRERVEK